MHVLINQRPYDLPEGASLADAVQVLQPQGPFAAAVNLRFVPRAEHAQTPLQEGDHIEIIVPVTGG